MLRIKNRESLRKGYYFILFAVMFIAIGSVYLKYPLRGELLVVGDGTSSIFITDWFGEQYASGQLPLWSHESAAGIPMATPYNGVQIKRNILESGRSQGCPSKSLPGQTTIRLPDKVCQPGSGLPEQTSFSVLQSVFAALGSGSYKTGAAVLPQQKHVPPWHVRRISRVLCA